MRGRAEVRDEGNIYIIYTYTYIVGGGEEDEKARRVVVVTYYIDPLSSGRVGIKITYRARISYCSEDTSENIFVSQRHNNNNIV